MIDENTPAAAEDLAGEMHVSDLDFEELRWEVAARIRAKPLASLAVAVGTGVVLGKVFGGGRRGEAGLLRNVTRPVGSALMAGVGSVVAREIRNQLTGRED